VIKRLEHFWKGISQPKNNISAVPPERYGQRFVDFISETTMSKEQVAAEMATAAAAAAAAATSAGAPVSAPEPSSPSPSASAAHPHHHHHFFHLHPQHQPPFSEQQPPPPPPTRPAPSRPSGNGHLDVTSPTISPTAAASAADPGVPERTLGTVRLSLDGLDDDDGNDDDDDRSRRDSEGERRSEEAVSPAAANGAGSGGASFALPVVEEMAESASQGNSAVDGEEGEGEEKPRVNGHGHAEEDRVMDEKAGGGVLAEKKVNGLAV
jgi:1-phosphatidylinositol-4-phosphate 5-kinase